MRVLAGDIGGTHTRLAAIDLDGPDVHVLHERRYESERYDGLAAIVNEFCGELESRPARACLGVACPVRDGRCRLPNLDWEIEVRRLAGAIGIPETRIINDFDALGHALELLGREDLVELQRGEERPGGPIALIGAGTGLGEGFLVWTGERYSVHASEGGHVDFAPRTALESRLLEHLRRRYGHVSYERVVSGPGLLNIYRFLTEIEYAKENPEVRAAMEREDPPRVISRHALLGTDALSVKALDVLVSAYGAQAGNLALTLNATAGVYVGGGIAPAIIDKLQDGTFVEAFRDKGRLSDLVTRIPVRVIVNDRAGLLGAAAAARRPE